MLATMAGAMRLPSSVSEGQADMSVTGLRAMAQASPGISTNRPITSGGSTASTVTREADPAAARSRA